MGTSSDLSQKSYFCFKLTVKIILMLTLEMHEFQNEFNILKGVLNFFWN